MIYFLHNIQREWHCIA